MTKPEIEKKVIAIIIGKFSADPAKISAQSKLAEDLKVDSFGAVELMFELEEAFGLKIPDSEIQHIRTVNDIVEYLATWLEKHKSTPA